MKRTLTALAVLAGLILVVVAVSAVTVEVMARRTYADVPKPQIRSSTDPAAIERGAYLVNSVAHCPACHLPQPEAKGFNPLGRPDLRGGHRWDLPFGTWYSANITPSRESGIGTWTDQEIARVLRTGVRRDGTLSVFMAMGVGDIADTDLAAIISYLRAQPAVETRPPQSEFNFLGRAVMAFAMRPREGTRAFLDAPPMEASVARGRYLVHGPGHCVSCHSPSSMASGLRPQAPLLSGGMPEAAGDDPAMEVVAPNLTPDPQTGAIYAWSEDDFVQRFHAGRVVAGSPMPWEAFASMTNTDLAAIWRYLRTVDAVCNDVGPTSRPQQAPSRRDPKAPGRAALTCPQAGRRMA